MSSNWFLKYQVMVYSLQFTTYQWKPATWLCISSSPLKKLEWIPILCIFSLHDVIVSLYHVICVEEYGWCVLCLRVYMSSILNTSCSIDLHKSHQFEVVKRLYKNFQQGRLVCYLGHLILAGVRRTRLVHMLILYCLELLLFLMLLIWNLRVAWL